MTGGTQGKRDDSRGRRTLLLIKGQQGLLATTTNWEEAKSKGGCPPLDPARKAAWPALVWASNLHTVRQFIGVLFSLADVLLGRARERNLAPHVRV